MNSASTILPDEDASNLKCSLCGFYLSIGPIKTSVDGTKYQCGRCDFDDPEITVRNFTYERIAKFMAFPCIYENCHCKVVWGQVSQHEQSCPYRTIICPILDCNKYVFCGGVIEHFNEHHRFAIISKLAAMFHKIGSPYSYFMGLLVHEEIPHFCFICNDGRNFKVSVYSVNSDKFQLYEIDLYTLTFYRKKISLSGEKIVPYNDRQHCVKCFLGKCRSKLHAHAKDRNKYELTTIVDIQSIKSILKSGTICCKVSVESQDSSTLSTENTDVLRKVIECPVCKEYMFGDIKNCKMGHSICQRCQKKLIKCPICEAEFGSSRNYPLEELTENIILTCQNSHCDFIGTVNELGVHEINCTESSPKTLCALSS